MCKCLDKTLSNFDHFLTLGDLNSLMSEKEMKDFCDMYDLDNLIKEPEKEMKDFCDMYEFDNLIKEPTCYKNADNPSSIDVILTNTKNSFHNSIALESGISDDHKMVITVMKIYSEKQKPITINYGSYKNFNIHIFNDDHLKNALGQYNKSHMRYREFKSIFVRILDKYAPSKTKILLEGTNYLKISCIAQN